MPVEIKELLIKAFVGSREKETAARMKPEELNRIKKEVTKEVTEKILRLLRQKKER